MSCPFFMPISKLNDGGWLHPSRLPLGSGWQGHCCAPGHEGTEPTAEELHEFCNLGYAARCSRLPKERTTDAIRFCVSRDASTQLLVQFVCEFDHRPASHGTLEYDLSLNRWIGKHADPRIQRLAECYLEAYMARRNGPLPENFDSRTTA